MSKQIYITLLLRTKMLKSIVINRFIINKFVINLIPHSVNYCNKINPFNTESNDPDQEEVFSNFTKTASPIDKPLRKTEFINKLKQVLKCSDEDATQIVERDNKFKIKSLRHVMEIVELLYSKDVSNTGILNNPFLLTNTYEELKMKLNYILGMKPRDIDDFVPLLKLNSDILIMILETTTRERSLLPSGHRIYYVSDLIKVQPEIVAQYFSTHPFMFAIPLENFKKNLNLFLEYNVAPINILRDLWAFRYKTKSIEKRLLQVKLAEKDKVMPWMVRCPQHILDKTLQLSSDSKALLGDNITVLGYLSNRLGYDYETTKYIAAKHPSVLKVRPTKINEILDYLLNEAGFTPQHIAQVPRILCHSLETTKERLDELKSHGCIPTTLVVVCKSKQEYQKWLNKWLSVKNKIKKTEKIND